MFIRIAQRFGVALVPTGKLQLKHQRYAVDFEPIDSNCSCSTCAHYTRAYLHTIVTHEPVACSLLTIHNVAYQVCVRIYSGLIAGFQVNLAPCGLRAVSKWVICACDSLVDFGTV